MPLISVTRLRLRAVRFLPPFARQAFYSLRQARRARGFLGGALLTQWRWTFWTVTLWDSEESMRQFMMNGAHGVAMTRLPEWCDEASVVHWVRQDATLPGWAEIGQRMREDGRPSRVKYPSPRHMELGFAAPRGWNAASIRPEHPLER